MSKGCTFPWSLDILRRYVALYKDIPRQRTRPLALYTSPLCCRVTPTPNLAPGSSGDQGRGGGSGSQTCHPLSVLPRRIQSQSPAGLLLLNSENSFPSFSPRRCQRDTGPDTLACGAHLTEALDAPLLRDTPCAYTLQHPIPPMQITRWA
jgi:hypothetical protein